jgi:lipopolysaccharide transport protein LptA
MKRSSSKAFVAAIAAAVLTAFAGDAAAQGSLLGGFGKFNSRKSGDAQPTVITSDTMDIDIGNNMATLAGNVVVDDVDMGIKCNKMIVYLENLKKAGAENTAKSDELDPEKSKQLRRIECLGDVVITRKLRGAEAVSGQEQKALAGKADYDVVTGTIVLQDDPVIFRGHDRVKAAKITIYRDSERMVLERDARIETAQSGQGGGLLDGPKKEEDSSKKPSESATKP